VSGSPDLVLAAFHWLEYLGLLGGIGSLVIRRLGRLSPRVWWAEPPMHLAFAAALAGGIGVLVVGLTTGSRVAVWLVATRVAAEAVALFLCVRGIPFVAPVAVLAAALLSPAGHASGLEQAAGAEFADALHVVSAGMWGGGILALASLRPASGWGSADGRRLLERFGRVAPIAFGVTALTGLLRATEQLTAISDLWSTPYGAVLLIKVGAVLVMLGFSTLAWRRGLPAARLEGAVAVLAVGATALLAAFPLVIKGP
jgi:putative copper resistance protein D